MSLEKWIAAGGFIASSLSAIAAFLAIRQTIIQRMTSVKPELIIKEKEITTIETTLSEPALKVLGGLTEEIPIPLVNVGLGSAVKCEYQWIFDYEENLERLNFARMDTIPLLNPEELLEHRNSNKYIYTIAKDSKYNTTIICGHGSINMFRHKKSNYKLEYVLPHTIEKENKELKLPSLIALLKANELLAAATDFSRFDDLFTGPALNIYYEDISGKRKKKTYASYFRIKSLGLYKDKHQLKMVLIFTKQKNMPQQVQQKLRKGYDDWIKSLK